MSFGENNSRYFRFYKNNLYWVRVIYEGLTSTALAALEEKIGTKYDGEWIALDVTDEPAIKEEYFFEYSDNSSHETDIFLAVNNKVNEEGRKIGEYTMVTYTSSHIAEKMKNDCMDNLEL